MPDYRALTRQAAQHYGISPDVFERQIDQESGYAPDVISGERRSSAGATGIAQFMPDTARGLGVDPLNPIQALDAAARWMAELLKKYGGDYSKALAAYNAGPGNVDKYGGVPPFEETRRYVSTILGNLNPLAATTAEAAGDQTGGSQVDQTTPYGPPAPQSQADASAVPYGPPTPPNTPRSSPLAMAYQQHIDAIDAQIAEQSRLISEAQARISNDQYSPEAQAAARGMQAAVRRVYDLQNRRQSVAQAQARLAGTEASAGARRIIAPANQQFIVEAVKGADGTVTYAQKPNPNWNPTAGATAGARGGQQLGTNTTDQFIVFRAPDGTVSQQPNPNYAPPKPTHFAYNGGYYQLNPDGSVKQIMGPPQKMTVVNADPRRPTVVLQDRDGNLVSVSNPAFDQQTHDLGVEAAQKALMGKQQQMYTDTMATIDAVQQKVATGQLEPSQASQYVDAVKANYAAALEGASPWQKELERQRASAAQQALAERTLQARLTAGQSAANNFVSTAAQLAQRAMPTPGGYHLDPGGYAQGIVDRFSPPGVGNWAANTLTAPDPTAALTPPLGAPGGLPPLGQWGMTPWVAAAIGGAAPTPGANGRPGFGATMAQAAQSPAPAPTAPGAYTGNSSTFGTLMANAAMGAMPAAPAAPSASQPSAPPQAGNPFAGGGASAGPTIDLAIAQQQYQQPGYGPSNQQ